MAIKLNGNSMSTVEEEEELIGEGYVTVADDVRQRVKMRSKINRI